MTLFSYADTHGNEGKATTVHVVKSVGRACFGITPVTAIIFNRIDFQKATSVTLFDGTRGLSVLATPSGVRCPKMAADVRSKRPRQMSKFRLLNEWKP
jgi:hypothetical protein